MSIYDEKEIHEKSPVETVEIFFAWMHKKARFEKTVVYGQVGERVFEISEDINSMFDALEKYKQS